MSFLISSLNAAMSSLSTKMSSLVASLSATGIAPAAALAFSSEVPASISAS